MTFNDLHVQELENKYSAKNHNIAITVIISIYFIVLLVMMIIQGNVSVLDTLVNLVIAGVCIFTSYKIRERNINVTITSRVINRFNEEFGDTNGLRKVINSEDIELDVLQGVGYIFTYKDVKFIYTSLDNTIKKYILE